MEKKTKQPEKADSAAEQSTQSTSGSEGLPNADHQPEGAQAPAEKLPPNYIIHHGTQSGYDRTARHTLSWFLNRWPKRRRRALLRFLLKTNQTYNEFSAFVLVNERSITFRATAEEVYNDALNWDLERPSYVRIWRSNKITHYVCAPECGIYGDYDGDLWDDNGRLKQEVKDLAISELKAELLVGNENANV